MITPNDNAPLYSRQQIQIACPETTVWRILTDINNWQGWQPAIRKPKLKGPLQKGSYFTWKTGGASINSVLHTVKPHSAFGWTGKTMGLYAVHNWTLNPVQGGTLVTVEESMEGWLARMFRRPFQKNLDKGMTEWLLALRQTCEATSS